MNEKTNAQLLTELAKLQAKSKVEKAELMEANQQLQATEQQLRACNQRLQATELQLRAYNQKLVSSEQAIRESEEKFRALYDNAPLSYQSLNEDGSFRDVNPKWLSTLGYERNEIIGKFYKDFLHPNLKAHFEKNFRAFKKRGYVHDVQFKIRHKKGHYLDILFEGCVGYNPDGSFKQTYCVFQDITERKQAEEKLNLTKHRLFEAQQFSKFGWWEFDFSENLITWSDELYKIFGITHNEDPLNFERVMELVHPDYHDYHNEKMELLEKTGAADFEYPVKRPDGKIAWIWSKGKLKLDEEGNPVYMFGITQDITERKQTEEELRLKAQLLNSVGQAVIATNPEGIIKYLNPAAEELYGWDAEEALGNNIMEVTVPEISAQKATQIMETLKRGESWSGEFTVQNKAGHQFPAFVTDTPVYNKEGEMEYVIGISGDITDRKRVEEQLIASEEKFRNLVENLKELVYRFEMYPTPHFSYVSPNSTELIGYTPQEHYDNPNLGKEIIHPDDFAIFEKYMDEELDSLNPLVCRWVAKNGNTVLTEQKMTPIYDVENKLVAIEGISRDITTTVKAEKALLASEEKFRGIYEQSPIAIEIYDKQGKLIDVNQQTLDMFGIDDKKHVVGFDLWADPNLSNEKMKLLKSGQEIFLSTEFDFEVVKERKLYPTNRSGNIYMDMYAIPLLNEKEITGFLVQIVETTERKLAEKSNKELLKRFELIGLHLPGVIYQFRRRTDGSFHFPYASHGITNIYGVTPEEVEHDASNAFKTIHTDDLERVSASINLSAQTLNPWHDVYRINQPSGKIIWVEGNSTPIKLDDGSIVWHGFIQDITERKQVEEELEKIQDLFKTTGKIAKVGGWLYNVKSQKTTWTDEMFNHYGIPPGDLPPLEKAISFFHPEDQPILIKNIQLAQEQQRPYDNEVRLINAQEETLWMRIQGGPVIKDSEVVELQGIMMDITERKKMENALNEQFQYLQKLNNSLDSVVFKVNIETRLIEYVNQRVEAIFGYSPDECVGNTTRFLYPNDQAFVVYGSQLQKSVQDKQEFLRTKSLLRRKNGETFYTEITTAFLSKTEVVAVISDITERKQAEEEIANHREHLEELVKERTSELEKTLKEVERMNELFVGREFRIKELRDKIKKLEGKA